MATVEDGCKVGGDKQYSNPINPSVFIAPIQIFCTFVKIKLKNIHNPSRTNTKITTPDKQKGHLSQPTQKY